MSLLMDALRKAEEAKKKAEQGDADKKEQDPAQQESARTESDAGSELSAERSAASEPPKESPTESQQEPQSIPDVGLEFEPEPEPQPGASAQSDETAAPAGKEEASIAESVDNGLALEPIDEGLSQATRKHFDVDATPDYSAQLHSNTSAQAAIEDNVEKSGEADEPAEQIPTLQRSAAPFDDREAQSAAGTDPREQSEAAAQSPASDELPEYVPQEPESVPEKPAKSEARAKTKSKLKLTPKQSTIRDRTESGRRGAQSLFAAKKQGKRGRIRIRRSTKIWAAQIAIGLMLMVGAYFYFFVINTSTDSFNVPEQYLVNQELFSEDFNESIAALDSPAEVEETLSLEEQLSAQEFEFEILDAPAADAGLNGALAALDEALAPSAADSPGPTADTVATRETAAEPQQAAVELADAQPGAAPATSGDVETDASPVSAGASGSFAVLVPAVQSTQLVSSQAATNSISFSRTQAASTIDPLLTDAYTAFQRDNLVLARDLYQQVLAQSSRNRDALLGLAAIASRNGEMALAMELYSRLLARDPSDAVARAGLLGLRPVGGPEQQERELRRLLELQPQVAPVAYALGNFYAAQDRWRDAQRYYFDALQQAKADALQGVPVNPDYAFNLAVSLEHLNESALAETYYREAIAFAAEFPAGFDVSVARERLLSLAEVSAR